jgi:hypothetical protein
MGNCGRAVAGVLVAGSVALATGTHALSIGDRIPSADVKMAAVDGRHVAIADVAGTKGTLVLFTCNACPWVKAWQARIVELGHRALARGIGVIEINSNDPGKVPEDGFDRMKERAAAAGMKYPYVVDATSAIARAFGATRTPEAFLFDGQGRLVYHGTIDDNARDPDAVRHRWLEEAVEALLAGRPVPVSETKALGCSIKFRESS